MKKVLALLLVVGFLIGTFAVAADVCEESSFQKDVDYSGESPGDNGGPAPCGGGNGNGGGAPG